MNFAHLHLVINHIPVLGSMAVLGLVAYSLYKNDRAVTQLTLGVAILIGVLAIPVFLSGEPAEEVVEHISGVSEALIEKHEDFSLNALISTELMAIVAMIGMFLIRKSPGASQRPVLATLAFVAIINSGLMLYTANLGGKIMHVEIRKAVSHPQGEVLPSEHGDSD
ncbi:MAG: hypothetical protein ACK5Y2_04375 [Bdellovibrionales bacterium]